VKRVRFVVRHAQLGSAMQAAGTERQTARKARFPVFPYGPLAVGDANRARVRRIAVGVDGAPVSRSSPRAGQIDVALAEDLAAGPVASGVACRRVGLDVGVDRWRLGRFSRGVHAEITLDVWSDVDVWSYIDPSSEVDVGVRWPLLAASRAASHQKR
jgi:hypothetical protein